MKNNFRFIFPRLIGATVIVGIAALIVTTLFKLLIGLVLIGGVASLIRSIAGAKRRELTGQYIPVSAHQFGPYAGHQWNSPVPVNGNVQNTTIVPIN